MSAPDAARLAEVAARVKEAARAVGFDRVGITDAAPSAHGDFLEGWLAAGRHGTMGYLARPDAVERRRDPRRSLDGARSVIVVAHHYGSGEEGDAVGADVGRIARYARGRDYHRVVRKRLRTVQDALSVAARNLGVADDVQGRIHVDTGPVLEPDQRVRFAVFDTHGTNIGEVPACCDNTIPMPQNLRGNGLVLDAEVVFG